VRRIDDPLVLPAAPRVRARGGQLDPEVVCERQELRAAVGHLRPRLAECLAATRSHLDLGGDQLADEMLAERA
jgi:hypothetical protein